jgi:aryl-alcohol dehydrogenase-like predicted oxidoreductase
MSYGDPTSTSAHLWSLDDVEAQPFFRQAVELGVTFWDTANVYQHGTSEELVGQAIKRYARREEIVLATMVHGKMHDGPGGQGLSRKATSSRSTPRWPGSGPTTSTSIRSTASIPTLRSRRPWRPCTTS